MTLPAARSLTAQAVADLVGGRLSGPGEVMLRGVRSLERAGAADLSMCSGGRYLDALERTGAAAVLVTEAMLGAPGPATRIVVADPARAMATAAGELYRQPEAPPSIDPSARIGRGTTIGANAVIGAQVVVGTGVTIGDRARLGPHVTIEDGVTLGDDVRLEAHVTVYAGATIGSRVWCKAGAVVGGPGFGYVSDATGHHRIPQVGGCLLEDDVELGSNSCIDRGSFDDTVIGAGTKIDNLVHIAHNVRIGRDCLIMACVGIAGSTRLGDRVILAGQSGVADHRVIGDDVRVGARSAVLTDVAAGLAVSGYPARPHREFLRGVAALYRLSAHVDTLEAVAKEREDA